jgi:predicted nucleotidyltransferase
LSFIKILIEQQKRQKKYFDNYVSYAIQIKKIALSRIADKEARLIVLGSVVRGNSLPGKSYIDILIISDKISLASSWQSQMRTGILKDLGDFFAPFEIHFATKDLYNSWYRRFIGQDFVEI